MNNEINISNIDPQDKLTLDLKKFFEVYKLNENNYGRDFKKVLRRYGLSETLVKEDPNDKGYKIPYITNKTLRVMLECINNDSILDKKSIENISIDDVYNHNDRILQQIEEVNHDIKNDYIYEYSKNLDDSMVRLRDRLVLIFEMLFSDASFSEENKINRLIRALDDVLFEYIQDIELSAGKKESKFGHSLDFKLRECLINEFKQYKRTLKLLEQKEYKIFVDKLETLEDKDQDIIDFMKEVQAYDKENLNDPSNIEENLDGNVKNTFEYLLLKGEIFLKVFSLDKGYNINSLEYPQKSDYMIYSTDLQDIIYKFFRWNISQITIDLIKIYTLALKEYIEKDNKELEKYIEMEISNAIDLDKSLSNISEKICIYERRLKILFDDRYKENFCRKYFYKACSYFSNFGSIIINNKNIFENKVGYIIEAFIRDKVFTIIKKENLEFEYNGENMNIIEFIKQNLDNEESEFLRKVNLTEKSLRYMYKLGLHLMVYIKTYLEEDSEIQAERQRLNNIHEILDKRYKENQGKMGEVYKQVSKLLGASFYNKLKYDIEYMEKNKVSFENIDNF